MNSTCTIASCNSGFGNCNGSPGDGCETNIGSSTSNCGACGVVCSSNHIPTPSCSGGACNGACATGFADCNNNEQSDGCEVNTQNDVQNCGTCGHACGFQAQCVNGQCFIP